MLNEKSQNKLESTKELIVYIQEYSPFYRLFRKCTINYEVYSNTNFNASVNTVKR